jgi:hypothetical protein
LVWHLGRRIGAERRQSLLKPLIERGVTLISNLPPTKILFLIQLRKQAYFDKQSATKYVYIPYISKPSASGE